MQVTWQTTDHKVAPKSKRHAPGMVISRKDTIIIAVLINIALLAILFATANKPQTFTSIKPAREVASVVALEPVLAESESVLVQDVQEQDALENVLPVDEIDQILQKYLEKQEKEQKKQRVKITKTISQSSTKKIQDHMQVTVQEGDMLSKLAKKYSVTVADIIVANQLESDALSVGQKLYIPKKSEALVKKPKKQTVSKKTIAPLYYTVKKGDSPWTIARKFDLKLEAFLAMNGLDNEEKARSLKVGQKIRIR